MLTHLNTSISLSTLSTTTKHKHTRKLRIILMGVNVILAWTLGQIRTYSMNDGSGFHSKYTRLFINSYNVVNKQQPSFKNSHTYTTSQEIRFSSMSAPSQSIKVSRFFPDFICLFVLFTMSGFLHDWLFCSRLTGMLFRGFTGILLIRDICFRTFTRIQNQFIHFFEIFICYKSFFFGSFQYRVLLRHRW